MDLFTLLDGAPANDNALAPEATAPLAARTAPAAGRTVWIASATTLLALAGAAANDDARRAGSEVRS